jgi:hypothetical protein
MPALGAVNTPVVGLNAAAVSNVSAVYVTVVPEV